MKNNKRKTNNLKVSYGGIAKPLGENYFLMHGATHEQGGIGIGKDLEVENGEIVKVNPKSIKVLSNAPIMNGISPAQLALGGLQDGSFENRFNAGFKYQEKYKDINRLNDDGTKAKFGKNKKLIGGEEYKIPEFKLGELPNDYPYYEKPFGQYTLHHTTPNSPYKPLEHEYAFSYITPDIELGDSYLYDKDYMETNNFYKDKEGNYFRYPYIDGGVPNPDIYTQVPYSEIRKLLPKRDYIGGTKREVGIKIIDKVPGLKDEILRLSEVYNISPDVFTNRLINEGWLQGIAYEYNTTYPKYQKEFDWSDVMKRYVSGYGQFGLDTFGNYDKEGKLNLRRPIQYEDNFTENEDNTGREYNSANFTNAYDALEAKAAMLEYFTKVAKQRNISKENMNAYVNAMYNMGEYHKDLNNMDYVRKEYGFTPYYKLGGKKEMKVNKRNISSTGGKKKAFLGTQYQYNFVPQTQAGKIYGMKQFRPNLNIEIPEFKIGRQTPNYIQGQISTSPFETLNLNTGIKTHSLPGIDGKGGIGVNTNITTPETAAASEFGDIGFWDANPNFAGTLIQGGANVIGALATGLVNRSMLNDLKYRPEPTLLQAAKLKTGININPQIREIKNTLNRYRELIDRNTASSQVGLARSRQGYLNALENLLGVNAYKENAETQLINQDRLNQQQVANKNIMNYNEWLAGKYDFDNAIKEKKSENTNAGIQTGAQVISDIVTNNAQWRNSMANIAALSAAYPNVTPERLAASGLNWPLYIKQRTKKGKRAW